MTAAPVPSIPLASGTPPDHLLTIPRVALVEDDAVLRDTLATGLIRVGFDVCALPDAPALYRQMLMQSFHAVVLDIGLPGEDGYSVVSRLRSTSATLPIVLLTGRGRVEDRVRGYQGGADVFLTKPVEMAELVAVLHGLVRRSLQQVPAVASAALTPPPNVTPPAWQVDESAQQLIATQDGTRLSLTRLETLFLSCVIARAGQVVPRADLIQAIDPGAEGRGDPHRIDMLVSRLRRKATEFGIVLPLRAVRGRGYLFAR